MKVVRILVATGIIIGIVWLNWLVVPALGIFTMTLDDPPLPENGYAIVQFNDGKGIQACVLTMLKLGWAVISEIWPFALACLLSGLALGYPLGELARRKFAIDQESNKALRQSKGITLDELISESHAENKDRQINNLYVETQQLKKEVARLLKKVFDMHMSAKEQNQSMEKLRREAESAKKELVKAKAKIRRLTEKERPPRGKID
jgi:hypothetical protein